MCYRHFFIIQNDIRSKYVLKKILRNVLSVLVHKKDVCVPEDARCLDFYTGREINFETNS